MRISDFLGKSRFCRSNSCALVHAFAAGPVNAKEQEAEIITFLPAVGGAGVSQTLAVQTAMVLLNSIEGGKSKTCLVDLDFQHGTCADYLDLEGTAQSGRKSNRGLNGSTGNCSKSCYRTILPALP